MKRLIVRTAVVIALLIPVAAFIAWSVISDSLPQLDGEFVSDSISAPVTIERDAAGIPHIRAANRADLAYATGFVHGQDRFFQMDLTRRNAAGELAALFGEAAVPLDRRHRFHRFRARASAMVRTLGQDELETIEAYARGVNDGLQSLDAKPFEYFLAGADPEPWTVVDSLLAVYTMYFQLNDERALRDIRRGLAHRVLADTTYNWLYPGGTEWDAPLVGDPLAGSDAPDPDEYSLNGVRAATLRLPGLSAGEAPMVGSNNWAVSGSLTRDGRAIVANDMHLGITAPNVFYRARMQTTDAAQIDLNGVTLPGAPILVAGSNGRIAWGNTNSYGDWSDAVIVEPGPEPGTYVAPDGVRSFDVHVETIMVNGGDSVPLEIRETIWGPVLEEDPDPEREFAVSWIAHHPEGLSLSHLGLETADNVDDALAIANTIGMPPQNFVVGDSDGNIGWTIAGRIPVRAGYDPRRPANWDESVGWTGWVASEDYPRIVNPPSGRIWTANARVVDGDALAMIGNGGYDLGARARQIRDRLAATETFSPADMLDIQLDDRAIFLARWRELLIDTLDDAAIDERADRGAYRQLADDWTPRASVDSVGYRLVRAFRSEVRNRVFTMLMQPVLVEFGEDTELRISNQFEGPLWTLVTEKPSHLLSDDYDNWHALLLAAVDTNIEYFDSEFDGDLGQRTWGERNTASIQHPFSRAVPMLSRWLDMPADPLPGDSNLPRAQGPTWGASERFAVSPGAESAGFLHMPAGQSGHPLSDFYRKGHDDWVQGRPSAFLPGDAAHTLTLTPAD